ncbi:hypothetical protein A2276_07605 [candidate division WOR-1 bacterium RIFOXYA12_FULL_43_27]|uniref:Uncharacterized protein n=1 Tax=candidate division WOR-1 bacterium RIFOXYC2_FULL_46_14 TaxID=1802587 RepID=A0A1F4U7N8_UNCSA|nr:MAG: hypothetical protein A2276_07605 [candidate division WOR-1 bacterium RIFOXYA12_FULL_43_27]OGC20468.1 MAG: hypothetical protein A2292_05430 [candidate division WOR-1 bacterium RIFOXYB2_FULL_46_45]OGC31795.1 MAG: hypothetical protein A2232_06020 [candidate division WOR-1 bacterium RIFOXYA2_FULL_46_56]OGC40313.1 MAG: hypothetical protein A2438_03450 [candidate division WOR-1 bacterium RIFOXYC2_FULL_46_14]
MGIEYVIGLDCPVKQELSLSRLIYLVKYGETAKLLLEHLTKEEGKKEEEVLNYEVETGILTADGCQEKKKSKISELLEEAKILEKFSGYCKECPANCGFDFGCYKSIRLPLSLKSESWLIDIAIEAINKGGVYAASMNSIFNKKIDGKFAERLRKDPGLFFESDEPLKVELELEGKKFMLTSNQIFDFIFGAEKIDSDGVSVFLFFSGGLKQGKGEDGAVQFYFEFDENPDDDLSITQLKEFFTGLFVSYNLQKEVLIYV